MRVLSVTTIKDEGPFLLEWLAWHRIIGVTDFLIYSNDCTDGSDRLLDALAAQGVLTHVSHSAPADQSVQWQALNVAWRHPLRKMADWMLVSDLDEFPMIHCGDHRLADLFAALPEQTEAIALGWRLFGNSGQGAFSPAPVTAQFTQCAPPDMRYPVAATFFKSLFRPKAFAKAGVHRPKQKPDSPPHWADGSGRPLPDLIAANDKRMSLMGISGHRALAEMHHYSLRSAESFIVKAERGLPNRSEKAVDLTYWVERNFNNQPNPAALALQDRLGAEMAGLMRLPGIAALHQASVAQHRAAFQRLVQQSGPYKLYCACLHAAGSAALPPPLETALLQAFQRLR